MYSQTSTNPTGRKDNVDEALLCKKLKFFASCRKRLILSLKSLTNSRIYTKKEPFHLQYKKYIKYKTCQTGFLRAQQFNWNNNYEFSC